MSQQPTRERSDCVQLYRIKQSFQTSILSKVYTCCGNFSYYHMHGSCTQYQKQLQEVEEKNAAAQEMQKKLEAELNEVS